MKNELTEAKIQTIKKIEENGLNSLIKPLTKEVELFDTYVAGASLLSENIVCSGEELVLKKEPNVFDDQEVTIYNKEKKRIGYLPELYNQTISNLLEAGKKICARVKDSYFTKENIEIDSYLIIRISVYMVDY